MRINHSTTPRTDVSFGKVLPVKVFIDGRPTLDEKKVRKAVRGLTEVLQKHKPHPQGRQFISTFQLHVPDYHEPAGKVREDAPIIRNLIDKFNRYIFTGTQVADLTIAAKEIGKAKHNGIAQYRTTKTHDALAAAQRYFDMARKYIKNAALRVREPRIDGEPLELQIHTTGKGSPYSPKYKLEIDKIEFAKAS